MNSIIFDINITEVECKIICPMCSAIIVLGKSNGQHNFSLHNYSRHFNNKHPLNDSLNDSLSASMDVSMNAGNADRGNLNDDFAVLNSDREILSTKCKYIELDID